MRAGRALQIMTLALGLTGAGVALSSEALTTNQPADSLSFVDLETMKTVAELKLSGKPAGIALSPDKKFAYVSAPDGKTLFEIDAQKRVIARTLEVGGGPLGIAANPLKPEVYAADWYFHKVVVIDAASFKAAGEIATGQSPSGLAVTPDGKLLLSADRDSNQVSIIDIEGRKTVASIPVGERPFGVTIDVEGKRAYTANVASDDVSVIDIAERKVVGTVKAGRRPYAIALAQGKGFITDQYIGTITIFDLVTLLPVKTIEACDHPEGIEADALQANVYAACWGDNLLLRIDATKLEITGKAEVGDGPRAFGAFLR